MDSNVEHDIPVINDGTRPELVMYDDITNPPPVREYVAQEQSPVVEKKRRIEDWIIEYKPAGLVIGFALTILWSLLVSLGAESVESTMAWFAGAFAVLGSAMYISLKTPSEKLYSTPILKHWRFIGFTQLVASLVYGGLSYTVYSFQGDNRLVQLLPLAAVFCLITVLPFYYSAIRKARKLDVDVTKFGYVLRRSVLFITLSTTFWAVLVTILTFGAIFVFAPLLLVALVICMLMFPVLLTLVSFIPIRDSKR